MTEFGAIPLAELRDFAEMTVTVAAAHDVGIFEALSGGPLGSRELARGLELSPRGVEIILPVLVELGMIEHSGGGYRLTDAGRELAGSGAGSPGSGLPLWLHNLRAWTRLPEALRSGTALEDDATGPAAEDEAERLARYMAGMAAAPAERVRKIVEHCLERAPEASRVLDLGGGPGHMARAFAEERLDVTLMDTPETVDFVQEEYGLQKVDRLRLVRGDFLEDELPAGPFDIVLLSNILHIYPPGTNRALLQRVAQVTAPGGVAAIAEFVRERSPRAARFALVMLLRTEGGNTYSESEYARWLGNAGFDSIRLVDIDVDRQLMSGVRT